MDDSDRAGLIRRGNELFNSGDFKNALKIYLATDYKDGIIRVADHLYFDEKKQVAAIKLYKRAGHQKVIEDFAQKAAAVVHMLLAEDRRETEAEKQAREFEEKIVKKWEPVTLSVDDIAQMAKNSPETKTEKTDQEQDGDAK
jgi:hypothetical protein